MVNCYHITIKIHSVSITQFLFCLEIRAEEVVIHIFIGEIFNAFSTFHAQLIMLYFFEQRIKNKLFALQKTNLFAITALSTQYFICWYEHMISYFVYWMIAVK